MMGVICKQLNYLVLGNVEVELLLPHLVVLVIQFS